MSRLTQQALESVTDWSIPASEIAKNASVSVNSVKVYAEKHGHPIVLKKRGRPPGAACWRVVKFVSDADWGLQDAELARVHGLSRERIRQLRKQFNKPDSPQKSKHRASAIYQRLKEVTNWMRFDYEIAEEVGCSIPLVLRFRNKNNIQRRPRGRTDWKALDWSKPSAQIAKETGRSIVVVCVMRRRHALDTVRRRKPREGDSQKITTPTENP